MPVRIPLIPSESYYTFDTSLDGTTYIFEVRWNSSQEAWYFDILDQDENLIVAGSKIMLGSAPGRRSTHPDFPPGVFVVYDNAKSGIDATYDDIGVRVDMIYFTAKEYLDAIQ